MVLGGFSEKRGRSLKDRREAFCVVGGFLSPVISFDVYSLPSRVNMCLLVTVRERKAVYACKMGEQKSFGWGTHRGDFGDRARAIAGLWIATRLRWLTVALIMLAATLNPSLRRFKACFRSTCGLVSLCCAGRASGNCKNNYRQAKTCELECEWSHSRLDRLFAVGSITSHRSSRSTHFHFTAVEGQLDIERTQTASDSNTNPPDFEQQTPTTIALTLFA